MATMTKNLLLAILVILVSVIVCARVIILRGVDLASIDGVAPSLAPDVVIASSQEPKASTTAASRHVRSTSEWQSEASTPVRLVGRIVDTNGQGLAGIKVRLRTLRHTDDKFILRHAVTKAKGGFVLDDLDPHGTYLLHTEAVAKYPGYRLDGFTLDSLAAPLEIQLAQLDLVDVEGTVVDAEHAPVSNFTLTIDSLDTNYPSRTVTTDVSGYFRLKAFPAGGLNIYTATPDYFRIKGLRTNVDVYRNLALVIDRGQYRLAGRILDQRGLPITHARITLKSTINANEYHSHAYRTRLSDMSGRFEFTGLSGIAHTFGVYANGYRPHIVNYEFQSFSDELEIRLRR